MSTEVGEPSIEMSIARELIEQFGSPCVIYNLDIIAKNINRIKSREDSQPKIYASLKACYLPAAIQTCIDEGIGLEVASLREFMLAIHLGADPNQIIWNAVALASEDLATISKTGLGILSINTLSDAVKVANASFQTKPKISLRVNPLSASSNYIAFESRLGFLEQSSELFNAVRILKEANFAVVAINAQLCVDKIEATAHCKGLFALHKIAKDIESATDCEALEIGVGGGLACAADFGAANAQPRQFINELQTLASQLRRKIWIEPGRYLFNDAGMAISTVLARATAQSKKWLIVDIGSNFLVNFGGREFEIRTFNTSTETTDQFSVGDRLSTFSGVLAQDITIRSVDPGDLIVVCNMGSYTLSTKQEFMFGEPSVVTYSNDNYSPVWIAETPDEWVTRITKHV